MKSRAYIPHGLTWMCLLLLLLVVASWIASIYELPVRNLLSAEGGRWMLSHLDENFRSVPMGQLLVLVMGIGIIYSSGIFRLLTQYRYRRSIHSSLSLKQKRALLLTAISGVVYLLFLALATLSPMAFLMGVTGSFVRSPLVENWVPLLSLFLSVLGLVYGIGSGQFRNDKDVVEGIRTFVAHLLVYLFYIFFLAQWWGLFIYTGFDQCLGLDESAMQSLQLFTYYFPLAVILLATLLRSLFFSSSSNR